jgi:predicted NBD/HSP70 family sugar kinase
MAGLADVDVSVLVLNDAELAAAGVAASSSTWSGDAATLVLTVGMGLGAAWLPRRS